MSPAASAKWGVDMLPSCCKKVKHIDYEIAQINSYNKDTATSQCRSMFVGEFYRVYEYRVLIKFNFDSLLENIQFQRATLSINIISGSLQYFIAYSLMSDWDINSVNWNNQPEINFSDMIFGKSVNHCTQYSIDITDKVRTWCKYPESNYGMVLLGHDKCGSSNITINTDKNDTDNLSLFVELAECPKDMHVKPNFFEFSENICVTPDSEFFTTGINVSLMQRVSYFIKNNNSAKITVVAENSPDNVNYSKEIQIVYIPPGSSSLLVPINYSKFVRLSITIPFDGSESIVNTWLNLQQ